MNSTVGGIQVIGRHNKAFTRRHGAGEAERYAERCTSCFSRRSSHWVCALEFGYAIRPLDSCFHS